MKLRNLGTKWVVGIDEAGRGPLAGPLAVGFVAMPIDVYQSYKKNKKSLPFGIDSKKLSSTKRAEFFEHIKSNAHTRHLVVMIGERTIDKNGLSSSIKEAIKKGLAKFTLPIEQTTVLLDGGLKAPDLYKQRTIIKGDEKERIIGLASICAKVTRDRKMQVFAKKYPAYKFDKHKGYGTALHRRILSEIGLCPIHRRSFCKNLPGSVK